MVCKALRVAERAQLKVHGCIVDSILFSASKKQMLDLVLPLHRDGSAMLQIGEKTRTQERRASESGGQGEILLETLRPVPG